MDFLEVKDLYNKGRNEQRNRISKFFRGLSDFQMDNPAARAGVKKYTSGGRLEKKYDLSTWKWISLKRNDVNFFISLQAFDIDPNTRNLHVLMDRIGIYAYVGEYSSADVQVEMKITNIELPVDDNKLNELANILRGLSECEIYKIQAQYKRECIKNKLV